ncbi:MAG: hypothetical protein A3C82_01890 [Candidatus Wildermuthbacteria bacterium RIFCSPHIGHO2_02_FULL_47_12]|uniref:Uncharacterized protein n=1 Tax=Candidatus Wildermuthbacteria bacterium RIFCSPHIGHO2_02_FULL_47_12 TaxID=1802451 RepID=A0A1G2R1L8_9BACT|nr:MAG: hypothetical protein A3C82_01890 [Candidatus Wildermuthbacteria bacterium RIFCSPHIGHO2_02_FULL_47_12]
MPDLVDLFSSTQTQIIVILIAADVILGVLGAVVRKDFRFGKVAGFMHGSVLAYVFGYAVLQLVAEGLPSLAFLVPVGFALVVVAQLASVVRNLKKLGLPLPGADKM